MTEEHTAEDDARMTPAEERDVRAAHDRDKWAGEWNSLPTAIDRLLSARAEPQQKAHGIPSKKNPPWWPTAEQKIHADAGCAHPDECRVIPPGETP